MRANPEYRDRSEPEVAVLDALVNRIDDGMTVFELRAAVSMEIDEIEQALSKLKDDDLITVEQGGGKTVIKPDQRVIPSEHAGSSVSIAEWVRERFPF